METSLENTDTYEEDTYEDLQLPLWTLTIFCAHSAHLNWKSTLGACSYTNPGGIRTSSQYALPSMYNNVAY